MNDETIQCLKNWGLDARCYKNMEDYDHLMTPDRINMILKRGQFTGATGGGAKATYLLNGLKQIDQNIPGQFTNDDRDEKEKKAEQARENRLLRARNILDNYEHVMGGEMIAHDMEHTIDDWVESLDQDQRNHYSARIFTYLKAYSGLNEVVELAREKWPRPLHCKWMCVIAYEDHLSGRQRVMLDALTDHTRLYDPNRPDPDKKAMQAALKKQDEKRELVLSTPSPTPTGD